MKTITKLVVSFLLLAMTSSLNVAQRNASSKDGRDSNHIDQQTQTDSLVQGLTELQKKQQLEYIQLLEKTNQQLGLWYNPYAIIVAALAVMFTLLAIIATAVIYFQSRDYKDKLDALVKRHQEALDNFLVEKAAKLGEIDKKMNDYQAELKSAQGEQKKVIEAALKKLETEKATVQSQISTTVEAMPMSGSIGSLLSTSTIRHHKCTKCGWGFNVKDPYAGFGIASVLSRGASTVTCPKCGNTDELPLRA